MKKSFVFLFAALMMVATADQLIAKKEKKAKPVAAPKVEIINSKDVNAVMIFDNETYDFGTIQEGDKAEHVFTFVNHSAEPIVVNNARPSCGCTTPSWSKEPVKSGASGSVTAIYATQGRPGPFNKTITVETNLGNKVLTIKGTVAAQPKTSVPAENSMIKH